MKEQCRMKANAQSHTHLQLLTDFIFACGVRELRFATANATPKIAKECVLPTLYNNLNGKSQWRTRTELKNNYF
jgi:hypothetical protein